MRQAKPFPRVGGNATNLGPGMMTLKKFMYVFKKPYIFGVLEVDGESIL